jgi:hypothetical protein
MTELSGHAPPAVYRAIAAVAGVMAKDGIAKDKRNSQQGYNFRGIDDVYNALAPVLSEFGLVVLPRVLQRIETERETKSGGALFNVVVEVEFDFVAAEDGSRHVVKTFGEAMDSADKATNKAMSAAYKYAAMQAFCIPTSGDNDADATSHEVAPRRQAPANQAPARRTLTRQAPPTRQAAPSQAPSIKSQQAHQTSATPGQVTIAAVTKRCLDAGLTLEGMQAMAQELSKGETAAIGGLPEAVQGKLLNLGVSAASVAKWNAAGAASSIPESGDDDPPLAWGLAPITAAA